MSSFAIEAPTFAGPLDTLLNLIEARKLSITEISLAEVSDAYLSYLEKMPELPLSETSQFVLIASTLLLIKSRTLLPTLTLSDEETESVQELEHRLVRLRIIRGAAQLLRQSWGTAPYLFARLSPEETVVFSPRETSVATIHSAILKLITLLPIPEKLSQASVAPVLALEDVIRDLKHRINTAIKTSWSDISKGASRHDFIVHFLAVLELVRSGSASVTQDRLFGEMNIESEITGVPNYSIQ